MRRVGEVVRTAQGLAVLRSPDESYPELGTGVVDSDLNTVGKVVDVFGPVERPYVSVSPHADVDLPILLGENLYAR